MDKTEDRGPRRNLRDLPDDAMLGKADVAWMLGISTATLDRMRDEEEFPPAEPISKRKIGWAVATVRAWRKGRQKTSDAVDPDEDEET